MDVGGAAATAPRKCLRCTLMILSLFYYEAEEGQMDGNGAAGRRGAEPERTECTKSCPPFWRQQMA